MCTVTFSRIALHKGFLINAKELKLKANVSPDLKAPPSGALKPQQAPKKAGHIYYIIHLI